MNQYDYIISGAGLSGLMLAYYMANDSFFDDKRILLIDKEKQSTTQKTWSFWEEGVGDWDAIVTKHWSNLSIKGKFLDKNFDLGSYQYKMIKSESFYKLVWDQLEKKTNFEFIAETVLNISHRKLNASILTEKKEYYAEKIFNSVLLHQRYWQQKKYPNLLQHFLGWIVEVKEDTFDEKTATFMDFSIDQLDLICFVYLLPYSATKALVEYVVISEKEWKTESYESELKEYLSDKGIKDYIVLEKEKGSIPMSSYKFWKHNSKHVLNMGTIGGWTRASTGFTFRNCVKNSQRVIEELKREEPSFSLFKKKNKFWAYDLLLLDILTKKGDLGAKIFSYLFKKSSVKRIFKFLDQETSFMEDLSIFKTLPYKGLFINAYFKYFIKIYKKK